MWKEFYESTQSQIYTSDYHLKLPLLRFDTKQAIITYSEMVNILLLVRPYEVGGYLKSITLANKYVFNAGTVQPLWPSESRLVAVFSDGMFLTDWLTSRLAQEPVVHLFTPPRSEDIDKFFAENRTVLIHGIEQWSQPDKDRIIQVYRSNNSSLTKPRLIVKVASRSKETFELAKQFDTQIQGLQEANIKSLCTYCLSIETNLNFNAYYCGPQKSAELLEKLVKIDYDYSKEVKLKSDVYASAKDISKVMIGGKSTEPEISIEIDLVHLLNQFTSENNSAHEAVDENRTQLTLYMILSVAMKSMIEARNWRCHSDWLSCHDVVSIANLTTRIIRAMSENTTIGFTQCLDHVLKIETSGCMPLLPSFSAQKLRNIFKGLFLGVFQGTTSALHLESEFYRFNLKSIKKSYSEIFNSVAAFPVKDPARLSLLTDRDIYLKGKHESMNMIQAFKYMTNRKFLKVSFTSGLKLIDSKDYVPTLTQMQRDRSATVILDDFNKPKLLGSRGAKFEEKLFLLEVMNELNDGTKTDIVQLAFTNSLITLKLEEIKKLEKAKSIKSNAESPISPIKPSIRQIVQRKSILENFRAEMLRRYSTRNRDSFANNPEGRGTISGTPMSSPMVVSGSIQAAAANLRQISTSVTRAESISKAGKMASVTGRMTGRATTTASKPPVELVQSVLKIDMTVISESSKRELNTVSKFMQSALWCQILELYQLKLEVYRHIAFRIEVYSGEVAPFFAENEDIVLNKLDKLVDSVNTDSDTGTLLASLMSNKSIPSLSRFLPLSLGSIHYDQTFLSVWERLKSSIKYIDQLARREDGTPETGVYEFNYFTRPIVFLNNIRIHFSLKSMVGLLYSRNHYAT